MARVVVASVAVLLLGAMSGETAVRKMSIADSAQRESPPVGRQPLRDFGLGPSRYLRPTLKSPRFLRLPVSSLRKAYTEHLGELITAPGHGGVNDLGGGLAIRGTDLGNPFEVNGRLAFLFGDSWTVEGQPGWDADSLAFTTALSVDKFDMPHLVWDRQPNGGPFNPLVAQCPLSCRRIMGGLHRLGAEGDYPSPFIHDGGLEVPVEGIQVGGRVYIFYVNKFFRGAKCCERYDYSVLVEGPASDLRASKLQAVHIWGTERFLNVNAVRYPRLARPGWIYIYGAGNPYRNSSVALARVRPSDLPNRDKWMYYRGIRNGQPDFQPDERYAQYMVPDRCVGEFSVRYHPATRLFIMAYGCGGTPDVRGYYLRFSRTPWGPWSQRERIFDPGSTADGGYGVTMRRSVAPDDKQPAYDATKDAWQAPDDGLYEPDHLDGREAWGGEYGPYLVPRWFRTRPDGSYEIVWLHSSWHPYKVHLMRTVLVKPGDSVPSPVHGAGLPNPTIENGDFMSGLRGWRTLNTPVGLPSPFHVVSAKGRLYVTSYDHGGAGDRAVGAIFQDFTASSRTCWIEFRVHGGHATRAGFQQGNVAAVRLLHEGRVVRETFGLDRNDRDVNARWNIEEFRGERLRLAIVDTATDPWGFISATDFRVISLGRSLGKVNRPCR